MTVGLPSSDRTLLADALGWTSMTLDVARPFGRPKLSNQPAFYETDSFAEVQNFALADQRSGRRGAEILTFMSIDDGYGAPSVLSSTTGPHGLRASR